MKNRIKNVGILSAFCVVVLFAAVLSGCNPSSGGGLLLAADVHNNGGFTDATIIGIQDKTTIVDSATVTVNGTTVPFFLFGNISSVLLINAGNPVTLHFTYQNVDVQSTLTMPDVPTITTVAPGSGASASSTFLLNWTLPGTVNWQNIVVTVSSLYTVSSNGFTATLAPGATSYTLPANILTLGSALIIVEAVNSTTSLGSAGAGSVYQVANQAQLSITVN